MVSTNKNREKRWIIVICLFVISTLIRGCIADYPKAIQVYNDELIYLSLARNFAFHGKFLIYNSICTFQKVLYCIFILPAFLAKSTTTQIRLIMWINSIIMSSAIFPAHLIADRLLKNQKLVYLADIFTLTVPLMTMSSTFMSEILYFPCFLWVIYFVLRITRTVNVKKKYVGSFVLGVLFYLIYLVKEISIFFLLAYLITLFCEGVINKKKIAENIVCGLINIMSFAVCFCIFKYIVFYGENNPYLTGTSLSLSLSLIKYFIYAILLDGLFAVLITGVLPVIISSSSLFDKKNNNRKFSFFILSSFAIACVAIAAMITLKEDFGLIAPRQHMRYVEPFMVPMFILILHYGWEKSHDNERNKKGIILIYAVYSFLLLLLTSSIGLGSHVDNTALNLYEHLCGYLSNFKILDGIQLLKLGIVLFGGCLLGLYIGKYKKKCVCVFIAFMLICNVFNTTLCYSEMKLLYRISENDQRQMQEMNEALKKLEGNVLYISAGDITKRLIDTYIEKNMYYTTYDSIENSDILEDGVIELESEFVDNAFSHIPYKDLKEVDYFLVPKYIRFKKDSVEQLNLFESDRFFLYKNRQSDVIRLEKLLPDEVGEELVISNFDDLLYTQNQDGKYKSSQIGQYIIYGPYKSIVAGEYSMSFQYDFEKDSYKAVVGKIQISSNEKGVIYEIDMPFNQSQVTINDFNLTEDMDQIEFRILALEKDLEFKNMKIKKVK